MVLTDEPPLYRDLMRLKPDELTANGWAVKAGVSRTVWSDMRRHGNPSRRTLEKLLAAAGSSLAEFEALRIGRRRGRSRPYPAPARRMPARQAGGPRRCRRSRCWRPRWVASGGTTGGESNGPSSIRTGWPAGSSGRSSLAGDSQAYAVAVVGESMWPRFRPGRKLLVSPAAPVAIGDDVLLRLISLSGGKARC